jgi:hypothetical protein
VLEADTRQIELVLNLKKNNTQSYSQVPVIAIPLAVKTPDPTVSISDCFSDNERIVESACLVVGGDWTGTTCELPKCASGEVLRAIRSDGTADCVNPACGVGTIFNGIDASGNPVCVNPIVGGTCGPGQYMEGLSATGVPSCRNFP